MRHYHHHATIITGLEERINFMLSGAERKRVLEDLFPAIYTPRGHQIADIGDGSKVMIVMSETADRGVKEKFGTVAEDMFRDKNEPGFLLERITKDTSSFITYVIDGNQEVICGCNLRHGTFLDPAQEEYFYIYDLCTESNHLRKGLAGKMLNELREFTAATKTIKWLWLTVEKHKNNGVPADMLIKIYTRYGYTEFKEGYRSFRDTEARIVPMRRRA